MIIHAHHQFLYMQGYLLSQFTRTELCIYQHMMCWPHGVLFDSIMIQMVFCETLCTNMDNHNAPTNLDVNCTSQEIISCLTKIILMSIGQLDVSVTSTG